MIALAGAGRPFHLAQERVHFLGCKTPPGAHRMMAGEGREHVIEPLFERRHGAIILAECGREIAQQARHVGAFQDRGHFGDRDGAGAEGLDHEPEFGQKRRRLQDRGGLAGRHFDDRRDQQHLCFDAARGARAFEPFIDEPLMRRVLIDDDEAVAGLGKNIALVDLRLGRAERRIESVGREFSRQAVRRALRLESGSRLGETRLGRPGEARKGRGLAPIPIDASSLRDKAATVGAGATGEKIERRAAVRRGRAMERAVQTLLQGADEKATDEPHVAKADLGLGRMDIDVDLVGITAQKERERGVAALRQIIHIGRADRAEQQLVADRPAIDEKILRRGIGAVPGRQPGKSIEIDAFARGRDLQRIGAKFLAENISQSHEPRVIGGGRAGEFEAGRFGAGEAEPHMRVRHREALDDIGAGARLGAVALQEFQPRGGRGEKIADFDARARGRGGRREWMLFALVDADPESMRRLVRPGENLERGDRADRRESLAAKAECRDQAEIAVLELGGRVALHGEIEIRGAHAAAVVDDPDQVFPARLDGDVDAARARVERILDEFLHHGGGPLDDLARGDPIDENRVEAADRHSALSLADAASL